MFLMEIGDNENLASVSLVQGFKIEYGRSGEENEKKSGTI